MSFSLSAATKSITPTSLFKIEGFTSQSQVKGKKMNLQAQWAELSASLKTQRLYEPRVEIESKNEKIEAQSHQALFKENEIIFISSVKIKLSDISKNKTLFELHSLKDPIVYDTENNILRGSSADFETNNKNYQGRGFKIDMNSKKAIWISELTELKSKTKLMIPHTLLIQ